MKVVDITKLSRVFETIKVEKTADKVSKAPLSTEGCSSEPTNALTITISINEQKNAMKMEPSSFFK